MKNGLENCIVCHDTNVYIDEEDNRQFIKCMYCDLEFGFPFDSIEDIIEVWNELPRKEQKCEKNE